MREKQGNGGSSKRAPEKKRASRGAQVFFVQVYDVYQACCTEISLSYRQGDASRETAGDVTSVSCAVDAKEPTYCTSKIF